MFPDELIGRKAVRTNPVTYDNGVCDWSMTTEPVLILNVTESHIVYERSMGIFGLGHYLLDSRWIDDNWADYEELIGEVNKTKKVLDELDIKAKYQYPNVTFYDMTTGEKIFHSDSIKLIDDFTYTFGLQTKKPSETDDDAENNDDDAPIV